MSYDIYHQSVKKLAAEQTAKKTLENVDARVTVDNPFCGDRITIDIKVKDDVIVDLAYHVQGCLLCKATANIIGSAALGSNQHNIENITEQLNEFLKDGQRKDWDNKWQLLNNFLPARFHTNRHGCITLPFSALNQALAASITT